MATITAPVAAPVFAPKGFLSKFKDRTADGIADLIIKQIALPLDATIKARNIALSKDDAVALTSSAYNAHTFAKGVAHRLALFAGGKTLAEVQKDLPTMAQCAIVAGSAGLKMGAGLTVSELRNALSVGIAHVMALPVKTVAKPATVAVSTFAALAHEVRADLLIEAHDTRNMRDAVPHSLTDAERIAAYAALVNVPRAIAEAEAKAKAEAEAKAKAEAEAKAKAEAEAKAEAMRTVMDNLTKRNEAMRVRAHAFAQLANDLGIKLTKSQLVALDALEAEKIPA